MLAGNDREALLQVADQLSTELGYAGGEKVPGTHLLQGGGELAMAGILNSEDELLVTGMRRGLAKVVAALGGEGSDCASSIALDGAEMAMRGELVRGNAARLPELMPSFVFLVTLPVVDQARALELSRRTAQLVEGALGS